MTRTLLWLLAIAVSVTLLVSATRSLVAARGRAHAADAELAAVRGHAGELLARRTREHAIPAADRHASELPPVWSSVLAAQGVPSQALASFSGGTAQPVRDGPGGGGIVRERASLVLNTITLPQLGRALAAWREAQPLWAITSIELSPMEPRSGAISSAGGDLPISASLTLEALVLNPSSPASTSPSTWSTREPNR